MDVVDLWRRGAALDQAAVVEVGREGEEWSASNAPGAEHDLRTPRDEHRAWVEGDRDVQGGAHVNEKG